MCNNDITAVILKVFSFTDEEYVLWNLLQNNMQGNGGYTLFLIKECVSNLAQNSLDAKMKWNLSLVTLMCAISMRCSDMKKINLSNLC